MCIRDRLHMENRRESFLWSIARLFCKKLVDRSYPPELLFRGFYKLDFKIPPEPSNINWEHLDKSHFDSFLRGLLIISLMVLLLVVNLLLTLVLMTLAKNLAYVNSIDCHDYPAPIDESEANILSGTFERQVCWCFERNGVSQNIEVGARCQQYLQSRNLAVAIVLLSSFSINLFNQLIKWLVRRLASYQRFTSKSSAVASTFQKLFFACLLNTAVLPLLADMSFFGLSASSLANITLGRVAPGLQVKGNHELTDFEPRWYTTIGARILLAQIISTISPHLIYFSLIPFFKWLRSIRMKSVVTQAEMNKLCKDPPFDFASRASMTLNVATVTLVFSAGMPILLPITAAGLAVIYWVDKFIVLRYSTKPPMYDARITEAILKLSPLAVVLHLVVGIFMYSAPGILPDKDDPWFDPLKEAYRFSPSHRIKKATPIVLTLGFILAAYFLQGLLRRIWSRLRSIRSSAQIIPTDDDGASSQRTFDDELAKMQLHSLAYYDIRKNPKYARVLDILESTLLRLKRHSSVASLDLSRLATEPLQSGRRLIRGKK
eukprot:TRINITY_DN9604_c0_g1_i3.p1 TRINITY_DN9604_c0_g1~~TRINITY_DN9604_c0_g1_i3.p1  ORF type:complete len:547 (+),score=72.89 TRINITY_DN9604_c0_g1_i3:67-1707(+)